MKWLLFVLFLLYCAEFRLFRRSASSQSNTFVMCQLFYTGPLLFLTNIVRQCLSARLSYELWPPRSVDRPPARRSSVAK
jgi:hypothetical protein